jgi:hypothetical protein
MERSPTDHYTKAVIVRAVRHGPEPWSSRSTRSPLLSSATGRWRMTKKASRVCGPERFRPNAARAQVDA